MAGVFLCIILNLFQNLILLRITYICTMQVDYIIVGLGLAGLAFAETLEKHNKSFVAFENASQQSSLVAAGAYNPVILKRFTPVWDAENQLQIALPFYRKLEEKLGAFYDYKLDTYRIFTSIEEQNDWFAASDKPVLREYMIPEVIQNSNTAINAPFGYGKLSGTGKVNTNELIADYKNYLSKQGKLFIETFNCELIKFKKQNVDYKHFNSKYIVFCEGFGLKKNPYFNNLPMNEAKGELLTIHAPDLKLEVMLKSSVFIMPLGNDIYKVGATFNWDDKTSSPTEKGKQELIEKLETIINVDYKIVEHVAGIRPTVKDRRPLIGVHKEYQQLAILNGLGTRGVMLAPKMSELLLNHLEKGENLPKEVAIERFLV